MRGREARGRAAAAAKGRQEAPENSAAAALLRREGEMPSSAQELPDGEGMFLLMCAPTVSTSNVTEDEQVKICADESCAKGPLQRTRKKTGCSKKNKASATNHNGGDERKRSTASRVVSKKGKAKAAKTKSGAGKGKKTRTKKAAEEEEEVVVAATDDAVPDASSLRQSSETNTAPVLMHIVSHTIADMQTARTLRNTNASLVSTSRSVPKCEDSMVECTGRKIISNNAGSIEAAKKETLDTTLLPQWEPKPQRYSVMPPPTIPQECRREHPLQVGNASARLACTTSRAPSAPSVSQFSVTACTTCSSNGSSLGRSAHTSLEEALDGLRPNDMLYPTRQLLTRSLASPMEKERTATVVFDLDETLCNNRAHGPAILRPGAVEMLKQLRAMYPRPVLRARDTPFQSSDTAKVPQGVPNTATTTTNKNNNNVNTNNTTAATPPPPFHPVDGVMLRLEIIIWTASMEVVARPVIARLDPENTIIDDVIYRDVRWYREGGYTKDLRRIGRHLDRNIIVENAPSCVALNRRNAILVNDFVRNRADRQLLIVRAILQEWLGNVNTFLVHRYIRQVEQRRHRMVQDGGESPEPDLPVLAVTPRGTSLHSSFTRTKDDAPHSLSTLSGEPSLAELELEASAIHFLTRNPFISPGTRYVKPSAWKQAMKCINVGPGTKAATVGGVGVGGGGGEGGGVASGTQTTTAARPASSTQVTGGGRTPQAASNTAQMRLAIMAKPRGHRLFADMARAICGGNRYA
ncbi:hypothetical protein DQ04_01991060 [Trypanosoma grayi]|uniref:hypothetical protein n=1 Tax=Trypanosoma grayi TaxID=71804 RepID=UPI0004F4AD47|nr:hypothetical protein DQ04_01991060 [Trypanosoma grayi]KEG12117.1 hypothetical protein DQ04_01991060 [Trypanosoma grayi]